MKGNAVNYDQFDLRMIQKEGREVVENCLEFRLVKNAKVMNAL
jgi:hypothetical protein